jgi:hypothetical protein
MISIAFITCSVFVNHYKSNITDVALFSSKGHISKINKFPYHSKVVGDNGLYTYSIKLYQSFIPVKSFQLIPDDCLQKIEVNGEIVTLKDNNEFLCDNRNGTYIDVAKFLNKGLNEVKISCFNNKGKYGLDLIDHTFYEAYPIFFSMILLMLTLNFRSLFKVVKYEFPKVGKRFRYVFWILMLFVSMVTSLRLLEGIIQDREVYVNLLLAIVSLSLLLPISISIYYDFLHGKVLMIVFLLMAGIYIFSVKAIHHSMFSYDYKGHVEYVLYLIQKGEVPLDNGGWSFYHPSLYYRCVTLFCQFAGVREEDGAMYFFKSLQIFSFLIYILYGYVSLKTLNLISTLYYTGKDRDNYFKLAYVLIASLMLTWPSNTIYSVRIGNDIMFYFLYSCSFYFMVKWYETMESSSFISSIIFMILCIWSKSNGYILFAIMLLLIIIKLIATERPHICWKSKHHQLAFYLFCGIFCLFFTFHKKVEAYIEQKGDKNIIVSNAGGLSPRLAVTNDIDNYLFPSVSKFIKTPFTNAFNDAMGRTNFWHFLFKTSLFGEFSYESKEMVTLAEFLSFIFLLIILLPFGAFMGFKINKGMEICVISGTLLIFSLICFRLLYPFACSNDFRYIYPALLPFAYLILSGLYALRRHKTIYYGGLLLIAFFVMAAISFQIMIPIKFSGIINPDFLH